MELALATEVWKRLINGRTLEDLGLPRIDGRLDLRGFARPDTPPPVKRPKTAAEMARPVVISKAVWNAIDFSSASLEAVRFMDSTLINCRFDEACCRTWGAWGSSVRACSFRKADLRAAALGGISETGARNAFHSVDFSHADLRQSAWFSADVFDSMFAETKLNKVDFGGTVFERCTFKGTLRETHFRRRGFRREQDPPNQMLDVDFREATLRWVEFHNLDLDRVQWPVASGHIVLEDARATLGRVVPILEAHREIEMRAIGAALGVMRENAGKRAIIHEKDLFEAAPQMAPEAIRLLRAE